LVRPVNATQRGCIGQRSHDGLLRVHSVAPMSIKPCVYDSMPSSGSSASARRHMASVFFSPG
jgi:hypothetical protein